MGGGEFSFGAYAGTSPTRSRGRTRSRNGRRFVMQGSTTEAMDIAEMQQRIEQFAGQVVTDLAAAMAGVMTNLGHKLGLYRALAETGPLTAGELARRTSTNERSVQEWLHDQVAGGYVLFEAKGKEYRLPAEH